MGNVKVTKSGEGVAWGALYWQYFEDLDKITPAQTPLKLEKNCSKDHYSLWPVLEQITNHLPDRQAGELRITSSVKSADSSARPPVRLLNIGDKIKVRIILTVDRNLDLFT